jgi:hypothetical protein
MDPAATTASTSNTIAITRILFLFEGMRPIPHPVLARPGGLDAGSVCSRPRRTDAREIAAARITETSRDTNHDFARSVYYVEDDLAVEDLMGERTRNRGFSLARVALA